MSIESQVVQHVANLARLEIKEEELETYAKQLSDILTLMEQLNELDTSGISPMSHAVEIQIPQRDDVVIAEWDRAELLANAPETEEGYFRVPKIIE